MFVSVQPPKGDGTSSATQGTVLSLPRGSRVLDAIRAAEKWSSTLMTSDGRNGHVVLRNGHRTASHLERLDNGNVVSILPVEAEDSTVAVGGEGMGKHFFNERKDNVHLNREHYFCYGCLCVRLYIENL